jgi:hypothetical protein
VPVRPQLFESGPVEAEPTVLTEVRLLTYADSSGED